VPRKVYQAASPGVPLRTRPTKFLIIDLFFHQTGSYPGFYQVRHYPGSTFWSWNNITVWKPYPYP